MISATVVTHPGRKRAENQDSVLLPGFCSTGLTEVPATFRASPAGVYAVIDGMGGHAEGRHASRLVAFDLAEQLARDLPGAGKPDVAALLDGANRMLYARMEQDPRLTGMGATIAGVAVSAHQMTVFNVGDARVYQHADGYLMLLSTDDRSSPESHSVLQSLGGMRRMTGISPHTVELEPLRGGDRLLVCSDGLTEVVAFDEIGQALGDPQPERAAAWLLRRALDGGAPDNVTFILLESLES